MKVFLTGGTGFIGKHLLKRLIEEEFRVVALVRKKKDKKILETMGIKAITGDIRNPKSFINILDSCDVLIHMAGLRTNWAPEKDFNEVNSESILGLISKKNSFKNVIVLSSVYAMGKLVSFPANERHPLNATDLYGKSKILLEKFTKEICLKRKISYTIIRPAIVYGPGDNDTGMVVKLIRLIKKRRFFFLGNGRNLIHLIYIDDLIEGILRVLKRGEQNQTFILAGKQPIALHKLVDLIKKETKTKYQPKFIYRYPIEMIAFFVEKFYFAGLKIFPKIFNKDPFLSRAKISVISDNWHYDITEAKKELGFKPQIDYRQGIRKTVKYYRDISI